MYRIKYQRKRGIKRALVMLLALVMLASVCFPAMWVSAEEVDGEPVSVEETFKNNLAGLAAQVDSFAGTQDEYNALVGSVDALRAEIAGAEGLDEAVAAELNAQLDTLSGTLLAKKPQELSDPDVPEEPEAEDSEQETDDAAAEIRTVTANANGLDFSVTGKLSENVTLDVKALSAGEADYIRSEVLRLGDDVAGVAYDITLMENGVEIQPDETVEVVIDGISNADAVYHLPHVSAADIADYMAIAEQAGAETFAFFGGLRNDANRSIDFERVENFLVEQGKLKFDAHGFSAYYIASGSMGIGNNDIRGKISDRTNDTVYTTPGTTLAFNVDTYITSVTWEMAPAKLPGVTGTASGDRNGNYKIVIDSNFEPGEGGTEITLKAKWGGRLNLSGTVNIVVLSQQDFIDKILVSIGTSENDNDYPVYIAVLINSDTFKGIPNEPAQSGADYNFYESDYTEGNPFRATNGNGIIQKDIASHADFRGSVDGSNTVGLVDPTGVKTKAMLTGIDWDRLLNAVFTTRDGTWHDTDGNVVDESKPDEYEVIPYVIKLETTNNMQGWHIDCCVRKKASVTLDYNNNIPVGLKLNTQIAMPNAVTTKAGMSVGVDSISGMENNQITVSPITNSEAKYTFTFLEWNTKPDGSGTSYQPDAKITLNENQTLYAIWDSNLGTGNLKITKNVVVSAGETAPDENFTFTVTIKDKEGNTPSETYKYTIYDASTNVAVSGGMGRISSGNTIVLKHNQYAIINDLPEANDNQSNVTIAESDKTDYVESWDGGTTESLSTTVAIQGGRTSGVVCTNTYQKPTTEITVNKQVSGNMGDQSKAFTFTYKTEANGTERTFTLKHSESKTLENLKIGETLYIKEYTDYTKTVTYIVTDADKNETTITVQEKDGWYQIPVAAGTVVNFNNNKSANIDTGVATDSLPYILLMTLAVIGAGALLLNKRRVF